MGAEARWNIDNLPLDVGAELCFASAVRRFQHEDLSLRTFSLSIFTDYNVHRGENLSPFFGLGIGSARCEVVVGSYGRDYTRPIFIPRVGIELFRHLRITLDARCCKKEYNTIGLSIGYTFGEGLKK